MSDSRPWSRKAKAARPPRPANEWREFVTPEGIDLRLRIGEAGERGAAFLIDLIIMAVALFVLTLAAMGAVAATRAEFPEMVAVIWFLGFFALRNFYFIAFEMRPGAATPGKRLMGVRVIARGGGALTADAIFARNAMRELEVFLPLSFLFSGGVGVDGWVVALGLVWSGVFLFFPLFNRDRLRAGDLIAGTMVVKAPKKLLEPDLVVDRPVLVGGAQFTTAQLDAYGVKELHVLEEVLRRADRKTMSAVTKRIVARIGWEHEMPMADQTFLAAYYAALRGRLESRMLFGRRKKDKFDAG